MKKNKCLRCGYEWSSKKKLKCCPVCRNYRWNETKRDINLKKGNPKESIKENENRLSNFGICE